jgi:hypothetical protein
LEPRFSIVFAIAAVTAAQYIVWILNGNHERETRAHLDSNGWKSSKTPLLHLPFIEQRPRGAYSIICERGRTTKWCTRNGLSLGTLRLL